MIDKEAIAIGQKVESIIQQLSLEDKIRLVSDDFIIEKLRRDAKLPMGIPLFVLADGQQGCALILLRAKLANQPTYRHPLLWPLHGTINSLINMEI